MSRLLCIADDGDVNGVARLFGCQRPRAISANTAIKSPDSAVTLAGCAPSEMHQIRATGKLRDDPSRQHAANRRTLRFVLGQIASEPVTPVLSPAMLSV